MQRVKILEERSRLKEAWLEREREKEKSKILENCTFSPDLRITERVNQNLKLKKGGANNSQSVQQIVDRLY